jgi:predicted RNA-binding protein YlqC (UPF0109 family)
VRNVLQFLVEALVEHPEEVSVTEEERGSDIVFSVHVHPDDMGQIIGRSGRVAKAIRSVMRAVGRRSGRRVTVDIR